MEVTGEPMGYHSIPKGQPRKRPGSAWWRTGGGSKWDMKEALLSRAEVAGAPSGMGWATRYGNYTRL